jgi:hypothetical protein
VLEGIGLIEKESKNSIKWKGATDFGDTVDMKLEVERLKEKRDNMAAFEEELDQQRAKIKQCLCNIIDDPASSRYPFIYSHVLKFYKSYFFNGCVSTLAFVTYEDIQNLPSFRETTVLAIQAPEDTQVTVDNPPSSNSICLHLRSCTGPINVLVMRDQDELKCGKKRTMSSSPINKVPRLDAGEDGGRMTSDGDDGRVLSEGSSTCNVAVSEEVERREDVVVDGSSEMLCGNEIINELIQSHSELLLILSDDQGYCYLYYGQSMFNH